MKTIYKVVLLFALVIFVSSCTNDKNTLTKTYVLEYLIQKEVNQPINFIKRSSVSPTSSIFLRSKDDL